MNKRGKIIVVYDVEMGRIIAKELRKKGEEFLIINKARKGSETLVKEVLKTVGRFLIFNIDPLDPVAVEKVSIETEKRLGSIDIWVNPPVNTLYTNTKSKLEGNQKSAERSSYELQVYGALSALRRMLPKNKGRIVFLGSELFYTGHPFNNNYKIQNKAIIRFYRLVKAGLLSDKSNIKINWISLSIPDISNLNLYNNRATTDLRDMIAVDTGELAAQLMEYISEDSGKEIW